MSSVHFFCVTDINFTSIGCVLAVKRAAKNSRHNLDIDDLPDIPEYDLHDVPVHFQPQSFGASLVTRQDDLHHRPDAPGFRRRSPPEIVSKVRLALEEMGEKRPSAKARGDHHLPFQSSVQSASAAENT